MQGIWKEVPLLYYSFIFNDGFNTALTMAVTTSFDILFRNVLSRRKSLRFSFFLYLNIKKERIKMPKESKKSLKKLKKTNKTLKESKTILETLKGSKKTLKENKKKLEGK